MRDPQAPSERRHAALQLLLLGNDPANGSAMKTLLPQLLSDAELQTAAIAALARGEDVPTMRQLLTDYPRLSEAARSAVINTACARTSYAQLWSRALQDGQVARQDLAAHQVRQMWRWETLTCKPAWSDCGGRCDHSTPIGRRWSPIGRND